MLSKVNVLKLLSEVGTIILKMKKLRLIEAKQLAQGHTARDPFQAQIGMSSLASVLSTCRAGCRLPGALATERQRGGIGTSPSSGAPDPETEATAELSS